MILSDSKVLINNANFKGPILWITEGEFAYLVQGSTHNIGNYRTLSGLSVKYIIEGRHEDNRRLIELKYD